MSEISVQDLTVSDLSVLLSEASDKETNEFNEMFDRLEESSKRIEEQNKIILQNELMLEKQEFVISTAITIKQKDEATLNVLRAENSELQRIDAKRLVKQNKGYKKTIETLKEKLASVESARKDANKHAKIANQSAKTEGNAAFHFDPETNNALRVIPGLYVGKNNQFDGVVGSPVVEFLHHNRGITRQGMLLSDNTVGWATAKNSTASTDESKVAREFLISWCNTNNIKLSK